MADDERLLDYLKRLTVDLHDTRMRLRASEERAHEPMAIVGMSCRYPGGVRSAQDLWELVASGGDAISGFPVDRGWDLDRLFNPDPDRPGTCYTREGGFVYDATDFDAAFFGISPREALAMDPQQRLLLEASWEALEDAGVDPLALAGSKTGVFAGIGSQTYGESLQSVPGELEGYWMTGSLASVLSGRVAYSLGFEGPAVTVDTACSSSLVAMHLACQALRSCECSLALAGGVTVLATPNTFVGFSRQQGLAVDGRCKSFANRADGAGFSEGVGVVVLERLSDAQENGHTVLGVVRGSAVNQDGASNGLTAPNGPSQQRVIAQALTNAGLLARDVDAVEAHGTGTTLGDPIEAQALLATYGQARDEGRPLWLGSIKSNIGHTQAAAGVAGVIKMVMAMRRGVLPRTLHVDEPSLRVDWSAGAISLLTEQLPWERNGEPRRAGVSSFGISGTNAHLILEEAPSSGSVAPVAGRTAKGDNTANGGDGGDSALGLVRGHSPLMSDLLPFDSLLKAGVLPFALSGKGERALRAHAGRLCERLDGDPDLEITDVGFSLSTRSVFGHRAVVLGGGHGELLGGLAALAAGEPAARVVQGVASVAGEAGAVFLFPGQGSQWEGMALELLDCSPVFAEHMRACGEALAEHVEWSLEDVLRGALGLGRVDVVQPALFAVMVSLAGLWRSCGVRPAAVVGHSQGEIAAACVAGGLSLEDAARLVALRSRALVSLDGQGGMVSVALSVKELHMRLERWDGRLGIAAVNGPSSVVVSGDRQALDGLLGECEVEGVRAREIPVDYAAHSREVEQIREEMLDGCAAVTPRRGDVPFYSTVTGGLLDISELDGEYWYRNLRETVQFEQVTRALLEDGQRTFIELSPHPVLTIGVQETVHVVLEDPDDVLVVGSLGRQQGGPGRFLSSLAEVWTHGVEVDWGVLFAGSGAKRVGLPTYAFQRERYWLGASVGVGDLAAAGQSATGHPLLGAAVELADGEQWLFTGRISLQSHPWLADHAVLGSVLLPGTAFLELALCAGERIGCAAVQELTLEVPLLLSGQAAVQLQLSVGEPDESGWRSLSIHSRPQQGAAEGVAEAQWTRHASGALAPAGAASKGPVGALRERASALAGESWPPQDAQAIDLDGLYDALAERGFEYGPAFQGLRAAWRCGDELFAEVSLPAQAQDDAAAFGVHPALLDSAFHAGLSWLVGGEIEERGVACLPFSFNGVELHDAGVASLRVLLSAAAGDAISLLIADEAGGLVATIESLAMREISAAQLGAAHGAYSGSLFRIDWIPISSRASADSLALLDVDDSPLAGSLGGVGCPVEVHADLGALGEALDGGATLPEMVLVDCDCGEGAEPCELARAHRCVRQTLALAQSWLSDERFSTARLAFVTRGAVAVGAGEKVPGLAQAPMWGLLRSAQAENPERFVLIDIDEQDASSAVLSRALGAGEPQLAVREGVMFVPRLARASAGALVAPEGVMEWRLDAGVGGTLEDLSLVPAPEMAAPLEPGQIRVGVRAGGLNFRDVMVTLGFVALDSAASGGATVGGEGAGVVLEVGPGVQGLTVGDRVMGLLSGLGPVSVTDHRLVARAPEGWSFAQAASVPIVFLTAYYGLVDLAALAEGERVLVHAAAGGVGMAATQLARYLGAEVFATASTPKWDLLRSWGFDEGHIASSRTLEFKERFLSETGGRGMDVVLAALAGKFVDASLDLLAGGGRFVEMGKTDIRDPSEVSERHFGVSYQAFDLMEAGPERIQEMLGELMGLFQAGVLEPLPVRAWDIRRAPEAFRFMSQARHTGKIVLSLSSAIDPLGTVLITGGTGTLGALLARHLVSEHGVGHLLLASRRGGGAAGAGELQAELESLGARVTIVACDVSDRGDLVRLLDSIPEKYPLRGVVHAAGVIDDGVIGSLTAERLDGLLAVKADAAWYLHELTEQMNLQAFVLFSSAAAVLGSPGQGNYAAANAFLDALAAHRRARGLPGSSLAWGLWEQTSEMTAVMGETDRSRMARSGLRVLPSGEGLHLFDGALDADEALMLPIRLDLMALRAQARMGVLPALFSDLVRVSTRRASDAGGSLARRLAVTPEVEHEGIVLELVRAQVATILKYASPEAVDTQRTFKELGFDSLTGVELRNHLSAATGLRLPATLVFDYPTIAAASSHLLGEFSGRQLSVVTPSASTRALDEPLAIVGMSCRYPGGVVSPEGLWELVASGGDAIGEFPDDRGWDLERVFDRDPDSVGMSYTRHGGFVYDAGEFDASFFDISPREALAMDPQQRLLLESAWETLEDAGIDPSSLKGSRTGVFAGVAPPVMARVASGRPRISRATG